jgi:hypothetical protein
VSIFSRADCSCRDAPETPSATVEQSVDAASGATSDLAIGRQVGIDKVHRPAGWPGRRGSPREAADRAGGKPNLDQRILK